MSNFVTFCMHESPYPAETSLDLRQTLHDTLHIVNTEDDNVSHLPDETKMKYFTNYLCVNLFIKKNFFK